MNEIMMKASRLILEEYSSDELYSIERFEELIVELNDINFIYDDLSNCYESVLELCFDKPKRVILLLEYGIELNSFIEKNQ